MDGSRTLSAIGDVVRELEHLPARTPAEAEFKKTLMNCGEAVMALESQLSNMIAANVTLPEEYYNVSDRMYSTVAADLAAVYALTRQAAKVDP